MVFIEIIEELLHADHLLDGSWEVGRSFLAKATACQTLAPSEGRDAGAQGAPALQTSRLKPPSHYINPLFSQISPYINPLFTNQSLYKPSFTNQSLHKPSFHNSVPI